MISLRSTWNAAAAAVALALAACGGAPSDRELEARWAEARSENARRLASGALDDADGWTLTVDETPRCAHRVLSMRDLRAVPMLEARIKNQGLRESGGEVLVFGGAPVAGVIGDCAAPEDELTFVASDGYRASFLAAETEQHGFVLAYDRDGKALPRNQGGPLRLVMPFLDDPSLDPSKGFMSAYYVTHVIVGTEVARLRVGGATLDDARLRALPAVERRVRARYRVGWPSAPTLMRGVRLTDLMATTGAASALRHRVLVRGKTVSPRAMPATEFTAAELEACDPFVVYATGDDRAPIPARLGGPLVLATKDECSPHGGLPFWPTFVEAVDEEGP